MKKQFYTNYANIQIIISLLRQYGIRHLVISAGNRHSPLVHSVENERLRHDDFFTTYSVVDERSASFVALGLIQKLREPVAVLCTSGTAACNYVSAVQEAFFQRLPLVVITADRNPMYLYQQEEQMSVQPGLFAGACKKAVSLPIVRDEKDFWYCSRLVNEALLDAVQGERGPVHINYPVENDYPVPGGFMDFETEELPVVRKAERLFAEDRDERWREWADGLSCRRILVIYGQHRPLFEDEMQALEDFCGKYDCAVICDILSNVSCSKSVDGSLAGRVLSAADINDLAPDVIITMGGNSIAGIKARLNPREKHIRHINISESGAISDPYKCIPDTVACSPFFFFRKIASVAPGMSGSGYFGLWRERTERILAKNDVFACKIGWSALYSTQQIMKSIPENSVVHLANSNSVRLCSLFPLKKGCHAYCNRGTNGIDGSMSSFLGNSIHHNGLSFLFIGDLSFFYDMNALWNRHVHKRMRILVNNNSGGAIFYTYPSLKNIPTLADHIAAEHGASVRAWAEDRGFLYLACRNEDELEQARKTFFDATQEQPMLIECFTDKQGDADALEHFVSGYMDVSAGISKGIANHLNPHLKAAIKKVIK